MIAASLIGLSTLALIGAPTQDMKPEEADAKVVRELIARAFNAILEKDANTFIDCCDIYVDCFFADGTLIKGKGTIEQALRQSFAQRPEGLEITMNVVPRSYRVLSPDIITVDWPAKLTEPDGKTLVVNTMTTVRKTNGQWLITSHLQSVPYEGFQRNPNQ